MVKIERIKVLVVGGAPRAGGAETQLAKLLPRLNRNIFDVQVAYYNSAPPGLPKTLLEQGNIPLTFLGSAEWSRRKFFSDAIAFMKRHRFDLVHAWFSSANHYGTIPAIMCQVPVVIGGMRGKIGFESFWPLIYSFMNLAFSGWIVNSRELKEFIERKLWFLKSTKIFTIHNGLVIDDDRTCGKGESTFFDGLKSDRPVVGIVGNLRPIKNHLLFIEMIKHLTDSGVNADYWIIGDGPMRPEIEHAIARYNLTDRVKMLGYRGDVDCALSRMDVFVLTSNSESCPNVLLEAMKASVPVVATNCTSLEEIIEEGVNGFVVPIGDAQGLCKRVKQVLADNGLRLRMGRASYKIVKEHFSMDLAVRELENAYIELLKSKSRTNSDLREKIQKLGLI